MCTQRRLVTDGALVGRSVVIGLIAPAIGAGPWSG